MELTTPYPVKVDHDFSKRWIKRSLWAVLFGAIGFTSLWLEVRYGRGGFGIAIGLVGFIGSIVKIALDEQKALKNYHCPRCGQHLKGPDERDLDKDNKRALAYDCHDCLITWDTRLRQGD